MDQSVIAHIVREGERWDTLAYRYYNDIGEINRLLDANPHIAYCEVLPPGETLLVPVISVKTTTEADLPPWMRQEG